MTRSSGRPLTRSVTKTTRAAWWLAAVLGAILWRPGAAAEVDAAGAPVSLLHAALIASMRDSGSATTRAGSLREVLSRTFHFPAVVRAVLGRHYEAADAEQRTRLADQMLRLSALNYATGFTGYDGEAFETLEIRAARGGRALVRTRLVSGTEELARFDYVLVPVDRGWGIVNVLANGVSDLSLKRAEYSAVIRDEGIEVLLSRIEQQVVKLAEKAGTSS